ncbi:MAG TPA: hypothetical protein DEB31_03855 [Clostridiales bacterium]|nr:hypothetical protein [Clostridiales bacterium]
MQDDIVRMDINVIVTYCIPLAFLLLFFASYRINRTNLVAGLLLSCCLVSFFGIVFIQAYASNSPAAEIFIAFVMVLIFLLFAFGAYILVAFLILDTVIMFRKERRSFKHAFTLVLAAILLLVTIAPHVTDTSRWPYIMLMIIDSAYGLVVFYLLHLTQFTVSMILCNLSRPRRDQDYIIVLGSMVRHGKVTPLLARRMDTAISFYHRQKAEGTPPKLVLSGGQGRDESCPESEAMRIYALEQGIPDDDILLETRSVSTLENMKFAKEVMDRDSSGKLYKCIYATNNYHMLRAGIFARKAGLQISGIGAKTAWYFLPNAILREYIAYLNIHLKLNIAFAAASMVFGIFILPAIITCLT